MDSGIRGAGAVKLELNAVNAIKSEMLFVHTQLLDLLTVYVVDLLFEMVE